MVDFVNDKYGNGKLTTMDIKKLDESRKSLNEWYASTNDESF
jgi:hypothetical protein